MLRRARTQRCLRGARAERRRRVQRAAAKLRARGARARARLDGAQLAEAVAELGRHRWRRLVHDMAEQLKVGVRHRVRILADRQLYLRARDARCGRQLSVRVTPPTWLPPT